MQEVTPWPDSFDVAEPVARVLVDGTEVDVESVSVSSELGSAMPERVVAGGGLTAATGDANIVRAQEVSSAGFNPWGDAERFAEADEVVVEAGFRDPVTGGVGCARQITGQVDALNGGALSGSVGLDFMDHAPALDRDITIEPLMQIYPPLEDNGRFMGAGLSPFYVTNRILRHCGFYSTPELVNRAVVSAPLFGSGVAEVGTLTGAEGPEGPPGSARFRTTPWGLGLAGGTVFYAPSFGSRGHGRLTSTLHVSFHREAFPEGAASNSSIDVQWGSTQDAVHVYLNASGTVNVRYRSGGVATTVTTLNATAVAESETFTVLVEPSGEATIYASNGASSTGTLGLPSRMSSQSMSQVVLRVPENGHRLGGVQVAFSATRNERFVRTAHIESPTYWATEAFPSQIEANCLDLLKDQAEAELAAMWVDEFGHFRWRSREQLRGSTPVGTLTSEQNLLDLPWDFPVRSVFSQVALEHELPIITRRNVPSVTVSDSRGSTLSNGDTEDNFFEPPADEDWHGVDSPHWMGASPNLSYIRRGIGSYHGGVIVDDDNNERLAYSSRLTQSWSQINPQRWLLSSAAHSLSGNEYIEQSMLDRRDWYGKFRESNLPIIRARAKVQWEDQKLRWPGRGPRWAPVFTHKVGPWVQNQNALNSLADFLGEHLTKPDVVLRDIPVVPDPRVQLGDVFWLEDTTAFHVRLRVVVMGKTLSYQATGNGHEMAQSITCRVIAVQKLKDTYYELAAAWDGRDYAALELAWEDADYAALAAAPLDRS